jgi:hypothetical protein
MFAVIFSLLVLMGFVSIFGELVMRVRLSKKETPANRLYWWRSGGDEVAATYQELYPRSFLPAFRKCLFWLVLACALVGLMFILWKRI